MNLPTLYKRTSTGADQEWTIRTEGNVIITRWGQVGGSIQETRDTIATGKNVGRSNETTAEEQAKAEATSQWEKKLKKGYVKDLNAARKGEIDDLIEGGIFPMLAYRFDEQGHKIKFPALSQPKLDGHRCIAIVKNGKATLWSRTRKPITGVPHVIKDLEAVAKRSGVKDFVLDGELYNHEYKSRFEELSSFIRQQTPKAGHEVVEYHVYDLVSDEPQAGRLENILLLFGLQNYAGKARYGSLVAVETVRVADEDELMFSFEIFQGQGYEGAIARNAGANYVNKRSYDLQKLKEFSDDEFEVVGVLEGRGKLAGHAIFECVTENREYPNGDKRTLLPGGAKFRAKMKGDTAMLKRYFDQPELVVGKKVTVKYQGITNKAQVPRFGVVLREYEEL